MSDRHDPDVESFLLLLAARRSPRTVDAYRRDLASFASTLDGRIGDATKEEIEDWLATMRAGGRAPSTIARRLAAVRAYLRHLFQAQEIAYFRLATIHNLHFLLDLMRRMRQAILEDRFLDFKKSWIVE